MKRSDPLRRRKILILAFSAAVLLAIVVLRVMSPAVAPPSRVGDEEAAGFADGQLLQTLIEQADTVGPNDRRAAVEQALVDPTSTLADPFPYAVRLMGAEGNFFSVVAYYYFDVQSFWWFGAKPYWGQACRIYEVTATIVTATEKTCAETVPSTPT